MCKHAVVDLEMCKVPFEARKEEYRYGNETIQIGAVLLNESLEIEDEFETYVMPQFGHIDFYIKKLTGICPSNVNNAPDMKEALHKFIEWLPEDVKIVSWGNSDKLQIQRETESKHISISGLDDLLDGWIDCQEIFGEKVHTKRRYKLSNALIAADINYEDGAHDGLIDAKNTALLFAKMKKTPELALNPCYKSAISEEYSESIGFTLGSLFPSTLDIK